MHNKESLTQLSSSKKPKEDLAGGTMAAKTSPPPCVRSGAAATGVPEELDRSSAAGTGAPGRLSTGGPEELGARAPEELVPDDLLLQKDQDQSQNKKEGFNSRKIRKQLTAA